MNLISQTIPYQVDTGYSPFTAAEFPAALDFLEKEGFTGIELAIAYPDKVDAGKLYKQLEAHNLKATTISTGQIYGLEGLYLCALDEEIQKRAMEVVRGHIRLSEALGAPPVTIGLLRGKLEQGDARALMQSFTRALAPLVEYAFKRGVTLQVEPINKKETVLVNSTYDGLALFKALDDPENLMLLYDTYHANLEDGDMLAAIAAAKGRISNVHLSDSHRGLPGYGDIDFQAVYRALEAQGYQGPYALETLVIPDRDFVNAHCYESVRAIMK